MRTYIVALLFFIHQVVVFAAPPPASAIASAHPLATDAGMEILAAGGNAFDAAIAVTATLAVVEPTSSGLGGGGLWLLHRDSDQFETVIDGRETAPRAAHAALFLDPKGEVIPGLSVDGPLSAAIPGTVAALDHLAKKYGRLPLARSLAPSIRIAREGFPATEAFQRQAETRAAVLRTYPASSVFLDQGGAPLAGTLIKQPDLATTLELIATHGASGFYSGPLAQKLVDGVRAAGGIWTLDDLAGYRIKERTPMRGSYQGARITSAPPPSSGGIALLTILHILEGDPLSTLAPATQKHLLIEAMRRAYRDRAEYLGDPDFVKIPIKRLTSPLYARGLRAAIRLDHSTPSATLPGAVDVVQGPETTHFSILDQDGNRVAATVTVNYAFGSGFVVPGTGVLLNDEMDDFSVKPGTPNVYGLVGGNANAIAAGKRPLSSMTPTFIESSHGIAILGTPGGSRIISMVAQATLNFMNGADAATMVGARRIHHQFLPDAVLFEQNAISTDEQQQLEKMGHTLQPTSDFGNMQAIVWDRAHANVTAASDPRGHGKALVQPGKP